MYPWVDTIPNVQTSRQLLQIDGLSGGNYGVPGTGVPGTGVPGTSVPGTGVKCCTESQREKVDHLDGIFVQN
jgi:hypothetical protein